MKMQMKEIYDYDPEAQEANVLVTDGKYEILCYASSFKNSNKNFELSAFMVESVIKADKESYFVEKISDSFFAYKLQGRLIDIEKRIFAVGKIRIELENVIPKDLKNGDFVQVIVGRIDFDEL